LGEGQAPRLFAGRLSRGSLHTARWLTLWRSPRGRHGEA
jgi:hypothetical protein